MEHRGSTILLLGIVSRVSGCFLFGVFAFAMGSRDLGEMDDGRIDPRGKRMTRVGRALGVVGVIVFCILLALALAALGLLLSVDLSEV